MLLYTERRLYGTLPFEEVYAPVHFFRPYTSPRKIANTLCFPCFFSPVLHARTPWYPNKICPTTKAQHCWNWTLIARSVKKLILSNLVDRLWFALPFPLNFGPHCFYHLRSALFWPHMVCIVLTTYGPHYFDCLWSTQKIFRRLNHRLGLILAAALWEKNLDIYWHIFPPLLFPCALILSRTLPNLSWSATPLKHSSSTTGIPLPEM